MEITFKVTAYNNINLYLPRLNESVKPRGNSWYKIVISTVILKYLSKIYLNVNKRVNSKIVSIWEMIYT